MNNLDFNKILSKELNNTIDNKYILLGVPKHMNLGDTLIWEAETQILDLLNKERLSTYFFNTNANDIIVDKDTIIVWNGGGYFNVYSRELQSYKQAFKLENIKNILIPDVVLGWDINKYLNKCNIKTTEGNNILYISRNDREKEKFYDIQYDYQSDWPTLISKPNYLKYSNIADWEIYIKPLLVEDALKFVLPYKTIISDRMHGAILSWLLGKTTILIDNSYHKSKSLYDTWLIEDNNITLYE